MLTTFTAFTPLLNAGDGLDAHHFADNVRVQLGQPETLQPYMVAVQQDAFVSKHEAIHFQIAKGWLWVQRDEEPDDDPLGAFMNTNRMAWELRLVLSCAALAGCGENSYWRNGGQTEICGVYRAWSNQYGLHVLPPIRYPYHYAFPAATENALNWIGDRLEAASRLYDQMRAYQIGQIPRLEAA